MKYLYHHRTASRDGQYLHVTAIVSALTGLGHTVRMVGPSAGGGTDLGGGGGLVAAVRRLLPGSLSELLEFAYNLLAFFRLRAAAGKLQPDVIYERYNLFMVAGIWVKRSLGIPLILEVNAPLFEERCEHGGLSVKWLAQWSERYCWRNADHVLPVTAVLADKIMAAGVPPARITVIHNGVDPSSLVAAESQAVIRERLGLGNGLVLGFVGFIRSWHGLQEILPILSTPNKQSRVLLIVGDGPGRVDIEREADRLGVSDKVVITGVVGRDQLASLVNVFDVALQPAVVPYASPLKLFEYMYLQKAIVAPDSSNIREIVQNAESALLFKAGDVQAFKDCVEELCDDPMLRDRLGRGARARVEQARYFWSANAQKINDLAVRLSTADGQGRVHE